ncbi:MAG: DUF1924 domain-containing protein [Gammaproteobacteria bacterium]|nr:DUF1924 domain-containing protein [Gammaproteobacteria bacterium]
MRRVMVFSAAIFFAANVAVAGVADEMISEFQQQGIQANGAAGKSFWDTTFVDRKTGQKRSCASCHGDDLSQAGKHIKTGKVIEAMAPSVNAERLTQRKKINKWFKRNCKWTVGRECTAQEKADILVFLKTL